MPTTPAARKAIVVFRARRVRTTASTFFHRMRAGRPAERGEPEPPRQPAMDQARGAAHGSTRSRARRSDASAAASSKAVSARMTQT